MSWKDALQPGSFREVPFLFEAADGELGRRVVIHEYPLRDLPYAEDLGRKARRWTLELFVLGVEYMQARDALIAAIEKPGPGTLVHPYLGTLQVVVTEARGPRESTREGGMARFSVTFAEAGENKFPQARVDTKAAVERKSKEALDAIQKELAAKFSVQGKASFVKTEALAVAEKAVAKVHKLAASIPTTLPVEAAAIARRLQTLSGSLASLIQTPLALASELQGTIAFLAELPGNLVAGPRQALALYRALSGFGDDLPAVPASTPSRVLQAANQAALVALVRRTAAVEMAKASAAMTFDSYDAALVLRDEIAGTVETLASEADDETYTALNDLRVAVIRDLGTRGGDLARIERRSFPASLPALVIAHRVYTDAGRDLDIVNRNRVRHPGFVPGGTELELLNV